MGGFHFLDPVRGSGLLATTCDNKDCACAYVEDGESVHLLLGENIWKTRVHLSKMLTGLAAVPQSACMMYGNLPSKAEPPNPKLSQSPRGCHGVSAVRNLHDCSRPRNVAEPCIDLVIGHGIRDIDERKTQHSKKQLPAQRRCWRGCPAHGA